jgi:hypothetical protein
VVVFAVLSAVLALVLLMLLLQTRAALGSTRDALAGAERVGDVERHRADELDARLAELEIELDDTRADAADLDVTRHEAEERAAEAEARIVELTAARDDAVQALEDAARAKDELDQQLSDISGELSEARSAVDARSSEAEARAAEVLELTHQNEQLQVDLVEAADEAAKQRAPSVPSVLVSEDEGGLHVPGFSPSTAWELELVRSERTWRYSVAANPVEDPNPFATTDNPLRLAVEIEALALREDVGAFIGIDWQIGTMIHPGDDPARAHLTLRLAQELLAAAARELSPSTLVVRPDLERGGVSMEVVASDPDDVDFKIPPPPIASEWIGIDEHGGMVVTVKVDQPPLR